MPMEEILFNPRLTGQARQLWGWLAAAKSMSENSVCLPSWQACELKMSCGTSSRRRSLIQLADEGFISLSADGKVVTMHDPVKVYKKQRQAMADEICKECSELCGEETKIKPVLIEKFEPKVSKETIDERQVIISAWNSCKPESYSKIRVLSAKQRECINKHLKNLGLGKSDINEFICSVCRGLNQSDFWSKQIDARTRNFNAVFGYGNPNDTKMKNIENLYLDGDPEQVPAAENRPRKYTPQQQEKIDDLKAIEYQISMNNPQDDYVQRFFDQRDMVRDELTALGIDWSNL